MNLAVNGRDAMPTGGRLTIETSNVDLDPQYAATHPQITAGPFVALRVVDSGTGMTPEVKGRLFEPYFTTKAPGKGTGLGMATVHRIVTRYHGSIGVYSELGQGTAITVYLPRVDGVRGQGPAVEPLALVRSRASTILIVEDEDALRQLLQRLLERHGHEVTIANSAKDARRLFAERSFELLLTDVVLSDASGPELASELLAIRPALKVVYMSGYTEQGVRSQRTLPGDVAFIQKPFTADVLVRTIASVIARPAGDDSTAG